ncbi:tRNA A-37 threonylcarbamoyl transferase component Bud32 [Sinomonas atrocyanea]|uniref:protein kinase domain-containing protein n=1 Tax=Sinomonas atrocyanea TaxID=37927 RepID=UPI00277F9DF2|nr:protein kinase [Sinomonas atrocyanea]MDP9885833.1 tRNA A-37 threonylcarbamoyl transferase component Bud32 [Sinomonas atrocyanea]
MAEQHRDSGEQDLVGGRYRLLEVVGRGSTAVVHRALDEFLDREVAVKLTQSGAMDEAELRRSDMEVKVLARLNHPGLVTLLDAGTDRSPGGSPRVFLVMELVEGADLREHLRQGPLDPSAVAEIGHDLCEALGYIHDRGVVHRDIKPANVLLLDHPDAASRFHAKLTDFGIAWAVDSELTLENAVSGTPAFLSPEQVRGETVGPASDIYSLGLVLLQCLTGTLAFPGPPLESAIRRLTLPPPIPDDVDPLWRELLTRMTAMDPAARPNAAEAAAALYRMAALGTLGGPLPQPAGAAEELRLAEVRSYAAPGTAQAGSFDRITRLASRLLGVPMATVSIVDADRIWFLATHGIDADHVARDPGLCATAVLQDELWVLPDASAEPVAAGNPLVCGDLGVRFYAAVPLKTPAGANIGTLSVLDRVPRALSRVHAAALRDLAGIVMDLLVVRREAHEASSPAVVPPAVVPAELVSPADPLPRAESAPLVGLPSAS